MSNLVPPCPLNCLKSTCPNPAASVGWMRDVHGFIQLLSWPHTNSFHNTNSFTTPLVIRCICITGMHNKLQVSVRFRLTPVIVYAINCVSLARLVPMTVRIWFTMLRLNSTMQNLQGRCKISTNTTQVCKTLCLKLGKASKGGRI